MTISDAEARVRAVLASPDARKLELLQSRTWTSHNIPLTLSQSTIDSGKPSIGSDVRTNIIKRTARTFIHPAEHLRVLDLGSLEGGLSLELAREGWNVTGIEGRQSNFEKAELVRSYFDLENLHFQHRDVKSLSRERDGTFDLIACCGLLYHLDQPFAFLHSLADLLAPGGMLFLDTHYAPEEPMLSRAVSASELSPITTLRFGSFDYEGRWFREPRGGSVHEQQWSAVSNEQSFWPLRQALIRAIYHAGIHSIMDLYGMWDIDGEFDIREQYSRAFLACRRDW